MAEIWRDSGAHTDTGEVADRRTRFLEEHVTVTDLARRYELPSEVQLALRDLECPAAEHDNLIVSRLCGVFITASYAPCCHGSPAVLRHRFDGVVDFASSAEIIRRDDQPLQAASRRDRKK